MKCPICKRPVDEAERDRPKSTFPFCSERCRLIDLGRWLDGRYQIPVVERDESDLPGAAGGDDDDALDP